MTKEPPQKPAARRSSAEAGDDRADRLKAALRANLARRKAQVRARDGGVETRMHAAAEPSHGQD